MWRQQELTAPSIQCMLCVWVCTVCSAAAVLRAACVPACVVPRLSCPVLCPCVLPCLLLVHTVICCFLQVILYDMGSGSTQAALIKYSTYGRSKSSQTNQFEVLDVAYDHSLGSNSLDLLLLKHFAEEFKQKGGEDIRCVDTLATGETVWVLEDRLQRETAKSALSRPSRPRCSAPGLLPETYQAAVVYCILICSTSSRVCTLLAAPAPVPPHAAATAVTNH